MSEKRRKREVAPVLISRDDAHKAGLARFYTGRPCVHGHLCQRFVSNAGCIECANRHRLYTHPGQTRIDFTFPIFADEVIPGDKAAELRDVLIPAWVDHKLREWGIRTAPLSRVIDSWDES